eukprot:gene55925-63768_t
MRAGMRKVRGAGSSSLMVAAAFLLLVSLVAPGAAQVDPAYAVNVTLYHEYQPRYARLALRDQDSGDLAGDAYFVLRSFLLPVECASGSPAARSDCDNPEQNNTATNVVSQMRVVADSRWGPYGECNVAGGVYSCVCRDGRARPHPCNASVGRTDVAARRPGDVPPTARDPDWA